MGDLLRERQTGQNNRWHRSKPKLLSRPEAMTSAEDDVLSGHAKGDLNPPLRDVGPQALVLVGREIRNQGSGGVAAETGNIE